MSVKHKNKRLVAGHCTKTRRVGQQETIQLRSTGGKYIELMRAMAQYLGLGEFLQKYVDFYYDTLVPGLAAYLPSALTG